MSRTALYQFARDQYGCGISEHIAKLRIRRAVTLLNTPAFPTPRWRRRWASRT